MEVVIHKLRTSDGSERVSLVLELQLMFTAGLNSASTEFTHVLPFALLGRGDLIGYFCWCLGWLVSSHWPRAKRTTLRAIRRSATHRDFVEPDWRDQPCRVSDGKLLAELGWLVASDDGARYRAHADAHPDVLLLFPAVRHPGGRYVHLRTVPYSCPVRAEKGFPWSFFLLISAAVLECMTVAANEWGHSLWISEEIFSVPFHWPFVVYGWLASGMFAVWGETIIRLFEIEKAEEAATSGHLTSLQQQAVTD